MPRKIIIAPDSFKGCLTAAEVADACAAAIRLELPDCQVICLPVADGGEGTADAITAATGGHRIDCSANDPLMRPITAHYGISPDGHTAYIDTAAASGLPLLAQSELNPLHATTFGTGQLILDAIGHSCRNIIVGLGGSATNDGGTGMLQALGFKFLDRQGHELGHGGAILDKVASVDATAVPDAVKNTRFTVACDVTNPFYGHTGAAHTFGPQKGADAATIDRLDAGMRNFAGVIAASGYPPVDNIPGAGAAGGLGGAFHAFLGAQMRRGIELVLDAINFDSHIQGADLVITGEGKIDAQTCMGKAPWGVMRRAGAAGVPTIAIAGAVSDRATLNAAGFRAVFSVNPAPMSLAEAMNPTTARRNITDVVLQILCARYS